MHKIRLLLATVLTILTLPTWPESPGPAHWRLELSGLKSLTSDASEYTAALLEYEKTAFPHGTLSLRLYPLFLYNFNDPLYATGFGVGVRVYQHEYGGLFGELGVSALYQSRYFDGNGSRVNFLDEIGIGYQFSTDWHLTLQLTHLSNAGLSDDNRGINALGLAAGYRF